MFHCVLASSRVERVLMLWPAATTLIAAMSIPRLRAEERGARAGEVAAAAAEGQALQSLTQTVARVEEEAAAADAGVVVALGGVAAAAGTAAGVVAEAAAGGAAVAGAVAAAGDFRAQGFPT